VFLLNFTFSQENGSKSIRVMFYNVENLFDTEDDSIAEDEEFLPDGQRRWTLSRYNKKLNSIFRTIAAVGEWSPPEIIGFSEIENKKVLEDLLQKTYLSGFEYGVVHEDSPDVRGIDVGLIYRRDVVEIIDYCSWIPDGYIENNFNSRNVLYVKCKIYQDTVHLFVNHWPSRIGGTLAKEDLRIDIAGMVNRKADSILLKNKGNARILIMGDFNSEWDNDEMKVLTGTQISNKIDSQLINLSEKLEEKGEGTYKYQGTWEFFDQMIVSKYFINCCCGLYTNEELFKVFDKEFLQKKDPRYPGKTPFSTFLGYRYQGGYSDHLPVFTELRMR
jgi:predicted extracellular nuclease